MSKTAVIAGVGPTLGEALAHKFVAEDYSVALLSRSADYIEELAETLDGLAIAVPTDVTDPIEVHDAFERVREELGPVDGQSARSGGRPRHLRRPRRPHRPLGRAGRRDALGSAARLRRHCRGVQAPRGATGERVDDGTRPRHRRNEPEF